jgi:hypothetical protein
LLKRRVEFDPYEQTFEEKIFRGAKRVCVVFAVSAVTLSALDIAGIRTVENASAIIQENGLRVADLPDQIRAGIELISFSTEDSPSVTVAIPRGDIRVAQPGAVTIRSKTSPVAELAAARHQDAIELAMAQPAASFRPDLRASNRGLPTEPFRLASVDMNSLPTDEASPSVSLPMSNALPLAMVPMPRPAPGVPPPSPAQRLHLEGKERARAEKCLANAIYFESRSEPIRGQMAVAQVVINRAFSGFYPNDICGVVYQNAGRHLACQFTFACDGKSKAITERGHWARANRIAKETLDGQIYVPEVAKSTHYHAIYVHPNWVGEMRKMVRFGVHNFYRPWAWGNGADEPAWGSGAVVAKKQ